MGASCTMAKGPTNNLPNMDANSPLVGCVQSVFHMEHGRVAWVEPGLPFQDRSSRRHTFLICKVKVLRASSQCAFFRRWRSGFTCTEESNGSLGLSISMLNASLGQHHLQFVKNYLMGLTNWSVNGCFVEKLKALLISSTVSSTA